MERVSRFYNVPNAYLERSLNEQKEIKQSHCALMKKKRSFWNSLDTLKDCQHFVKPDSEKIYARINKVLK